MISREKNPDRLFFSNFNQWLNLSHGELNRQFWYTTVMEIIILLFQYISILM